jgi:hypothetical protein
MDNKRIIKNYLPLLQDLQTKVANYGRDVCMEIHCSSLGISTTMSREIDNPEFPREIMHEHFNIGYTEDIARQADKTLPESTVLAYWLDRMSLGTA